MKKMAVLDDYSGAAASLAPWSKLAERVEIDFFHDHRTDIDELVSRLEPYQIICAMRERTVFSAQLIDRLPNLRHLFTSGMRNAAIDLEAATRNGIVVSGSPTLSYPTVELTFGLMLALARDVVGQSGSLRDGGWQTALGVSLHNKTLGIIGLGRLGSAVAHIAAAFGMEVIAWSRNLTEEKCAQEGVELRSFEALMAESDVISIHVKLGEGSRGLINEQALAHIKRTALLINTSRGEVVNDQDLVAALSEGRLLGAALDVFDQEPLPADHPLLAAPRLLLTPHLGYSVEENFRLFFEQAIENISAWLGGEIINRLN
ncbi:MAG: D-2-hydroxyacid dehydrogenase family protein [Gammaproteobacteria bacterium]|nr:D-2-hydroxyacid dehydrogenase family protein [Gammaproteobacteria bacterium]MDH3416299.1 D-2-hydroxyacid dehydrogenase family protein [Gammaproteobacteria bacterium]